jgi:hypothetical protein
MRVWIAVEVSWGKRGVSGYPRDETPQLAAIDAGGARPTGIDQVSQATLREQRHSRLRWFAFFGIRTRDQGQR